MAQKLSVAGILKEADRFLVTLRPPGGAMGGCWEFPGGKVEALETPSQALRREWQEELNVTIQVGKELARGRFRHKNDDFELVALQVASYEGILLLREHKEFRWVTNRELLDLPLVDSDRMLFQALEG